MQNASWPGVTTSPGLEIPTPGQPLFTPTVASSGSWIAEPNEGQAFLQAGPAPGLQLDV